MLLDAAGFDVVIVETVGVGQDEVEIARLADVTLVVLTPGMGDDVQAIKAGIMEIADVFVINKADLPGAEKLERELKASSTLAHRPTAGFPRSCGRSPAKARDREALRRLRNRARRDPAARRKSGRTLARNAARPFARSRPRRISCRGREVAERLRSYSVIHEWLNDTKRQIDHLGIAVRSIDQALAFYQDNSGCVGRAGNRGA